MVKRDSTHSEDRRAASWLFRVPGKGEGRLGKECSGTPHTKILLGTKKMSLLDECPHFGSQNLWCLGIEIVSCLSRCPDRVS